MARRLRRTGITESDLKVISAVRSSFKKIDSRRLEDYLRAHPSAQVQDISDAFLFGLVLERRGPTSRGYQLVYSRLLKARKRLGIKSPRRHSVARYRDSPNPPSPRDSHEPTDQTGR